MALGASEIIPLANLLHEQFERERTELDVLRQYVVGKQGLPLVVPADAPLEVREMARISRINIISIVVNALVESLFVDNMRAVDDPAAPELDEAAIEQAESEAEQVVRQVWDVWQANKLDAGQSGLYRAVFTYGYGYMLVTAGTPMPVVRPVSPRMMTVMYGRDPDWPECALEKRRGGRWDLIEQTHVYELGRDEKGRFEVIGEREHGLSYCPVIRYLDAEDLDIDDEPMWAETIGQHRGGRQTTNIVAGQVAPLMTLQDQQDVTTFGLLSAQWYSAFRQRWIIGWTPESRSAKISAAASQMWTFEDAPDDVKIGEFAETTLDGYLRSRDATARFAATLSQTPVHELIGELVNLSAEALAAAEAGRDRKVDLRKTGFGESHEQMSQAVGDLLGIDVPDDIEVVWRDTSARAFGALVDGLGKLAQMLGIPPEALWERVPGATRQEIAKWKAMRREGDAMASLTRLLDQQATPPQQPAIGAGGEQRTESGLILPPGMSA